MVKKLRTSNIVSYHKVLKLEDVICGANRKNRIDPADGRPSDLEGSQKQNGRKLYRDRRRARGNERKIESFENRGAEIYASQSTP